MANRLGRQTVALPAPVHILSHAAVGGKHEGEGPLADWFDQLCTDSFFGEKTWEKAESAMQKAALGKALGKAGLKRADLDSILPGDLLNHCIATSFGLRTSASPSTASTAPAPPWGRAWRWAPCWWRGASRSGWGP